MPADYYAVLGVERDATPAEVKRAFRQLARELHPDVNDHDPEAEEKFKAAAEAYEVLSDPQRRNAYDSYGHEGLRSGGFPPGGGFSSIDEIFQAFFGSGGFGFEVRRGPMRGQDLIHTIEISAIDAILGLTVKIPSHEGERELDLPPGIQPGTRFALRGQGLPGSNGGPPGDLVIGVAVIVPTGLSDEQRGLAEKLAETIEPHNLSSRGDEESFFSRVRRAFG